MQARILGLSGLVAGCSVAALMPVVVAIRTARLWGVQGVGRGRWTVRCRQRIP